MTTGLATTPPPPDPELAALIAARLKRHVPANDIILEVCQAAHLSWPEAAKLVRAVAAQHPQRRSPLERVAVTAAAIIGLLPVVAGLIWVLTLFAPGLLADPHHFYYSRGFIGPQARYPQRAFQAQAGQVVRIHYDATVTQGYAAICVDKGFSFKRTEGVAEAMQSFDHNIYIRQTGSRDVTIPITQSGDYEIWVYRSDFAGEYDIWWTVADGTQPRQ